MEKTSKAVMEKRAEGTVMQQRRAGIHRMEVYFPRFATTALELETADRQNGKYTKGMEMIEYRCCGDDEDATSMALTAVARLMERNGVEWNSVGWVGVGTESLTDRSKSIKSSVMRLFEERGASQNCEGVDHYNACYGGTATLFAAVDWASGAAWDGRWAVVVCSDIADGPEGYEFSDGGGGCGDAGGAERGGCSWRVRGRAGWWIGGTFGSRWDGRAWVR